MGSARQSVLKRQRWASTLEGWRCICEGQPVVYCDYSALSKDAGPERPSVWCLSRLSFASRAISWWTRASLVVCAAIHTEAFKGEKIRATNLGTA